MAHRDMVVRPGLAGDLGGAKLMCGIGIGVQEMDDGDPSSSS